MVMDKESIDGGFQIDFLLDLGQLRLNFNQDATGTVLFCIHANSSARIYRMNTKYGDLDSSGPWFTTPWEQNWCIWEINTVCVWSKKEK